MKWWFNPTDEVDRKLRHFWTTQCPGRSILVQCTPAKMRRITRWEHEGVLNQVPHALRLRLQTLEHPHGTLKHEWA